MKKLVLLFVAAVASISSFAQLSIGAKAGLNLANVYGDDAEDMDLRPALHIGGYLNYAVSDAISIQPELLYSSMGAKFNEEIFGSDLKVTMKFNYISVPVMFIYSFGAINVQAGPQVSFLASGKAKVEYDGESEEEDIKDQMKGVDFGVNLGLGADFGKFNASARYLLGLSSIDKDGEADTKNTAIQISIGYRLFGGK
jgi:hypothetical protein